MSIEAMKQALEALRNAEVVYMEQLNAMYVLQQAIEQAEMVGKGTKAWADTPDNWVDDLRGGAEKPWVKTYAGGEPNYTTPEQIVPSDYSNSHQPVAFRNINTGEFCTGGFLRRDWAKWQPLYAAPREWVGLTDEDRSELLTQHHGWNEFGQAIEAKLKEKNA
jgi:hypothetical protein